MKYWFDWTDEEIANLWKSPRTCSVNQRKLEKKRRMQYITIRIAKRIGTITCYAKKLFIKISISILIKIVEGQDVESIATAIDYNRNTSSMPNEGNTPTITC